MESMQYAESVVKEFLLFRGFTHTLHSFDSEVEADIGHGLQVDRIVDLLFTVYVPRFEAENMINLMAYLQQSFFSSADERYHSTVRKLEASLKKYYIVHAVQKGRSDRVVHFFERHGDSLLRYGDDWPSWFAIPYMKNPSVDPRFQVYFSKEWLDTLIVSFRNFLSEVFDSIPLPTLLKLHSEREKSKAMKHELEKMRTDCAQLRLNLKAKVEEISRLKSDYESTRSQRLGERQDENKTGFAPSQLSSSSLDNGKKLLPSTKDELTLRSDQEVELESPSLYTSYAHEIESSVSSASLKTENDEMTGGTGKRWATEEEVPQVIVESQETFSGHTSPITRCRFSTAGSNVASASVDGTVRIWTPDAAASTSRNAAIYCGAEILSLEWENKSDRLLLLGTAEHGVKAWNVEAKRVVCDLNTDAAFPRILELKCSPTEALFLCVAATEPSKNAIQGVENIGFGSLAVWNMRTWKLMNVLPLGEDPPVVTSVCFNHNGKLVAAGATDGMIRLFDMNGCLPITGWPAHDGCAVSSVRFGHDHSSIFSLGSDGKVLEWSLHNQGQILQSHDASMFCSMDGSKVPRHEMALDSLGKSLLVSSNLRSAPLFKLNGTAKAYRTLEHNGGVTSVDWHPLLTTYLTGSSDHSVRVTSIL